MIIFVSSDRGYFTLRYILPGYTFLLLIISINFLPLLTFINKISSPEIFGIIIAVVTLFTGSPLGFIVSQVWWLRFHQKGGILGLKEFHEEKEIIEKQFQGILKVNNNMEVIEAILDLSIFLEEDKKLLDLIQRRWDMYHNLSSTYYTMGIGYLFGVIFRVILHLNGFLIEDNDIQIWYIFSIITFLMIILFYKAREEMLKRYYPLHKAIVMKSLYKNLQQLKKVFQDPNTSVDENTL
jgi:hypothetical protein